MLRSVHLAGLVLLAVLTAACDKVPLFAPSQSTITVTAGQRILPLNASVEVTAVVIESGGTPVQNGTTVRFTTSLGRVDPVEVETRNGVATTTFYAGDASGVADVRAFSGAAGNSSTSAAGNGNGNAPATSSATNVITFTIGSAATDTVTISSKPSSVPATGGTVELNAVVRGTNGQGLAGVPVTFSANHGTLTSTVAVTDGNGVATVGLSTNVETSVSAVSGSKSTTAPAVIAILATPSVTLTCQGSGASGLTSCSQAVGLAFTFTATRVSTSSVLSAAHLDFDDGNRMDLGTLTSAVTVTHTYFSVNPYTVALVATDINGQTTRSAVAVNVTAATIKAPLTATFSTQTISTATTTGQLASFAVTVTAAGESNIPIESVSWNFGDGISATTSGLSTAHVYDAATSVPAASSATTRAYTVTATVRTQDGRTGTARTEIQIKLLP